MCIKGDNVITHYHNIDNTTFFTADGYLKTGDIASMNEQGAIKIYDRKKDMIIVSGFNVYPNEVETSLRSTLRLPNVQWLVLMISCRVSRSKPTL